MIRIEVPATTANIGPCFDSAGIAFNLCNVFYFEACNHLEIEGCDDAYKNEDNLVFVAYKSVFEYAHRELIYPSIKIETHVPVSRGLGSSSTCIIGGVLGANAMLGNPLTHEELFELCTNIEGHPDNVAPALFGGLTASMMVNQKPVSVRYEIHKSLKFAALIPDFELRTSLARSVLPKTIDFADAVFNISRAALSLRAFELGDTKLLQQSLDDHLHQPYRAKLIDEYEHVVALAKEQGALATFISGAGPTIMTLYEDDTYPKMLEKALAACTNKWCVVPLVVDEQGAFARNERE